MTKSQILRWRWHCFLNCDCAVHFSFASLNLYVCFSSKKSWSRIATLLSAWNSTKTCSASRANGWTSMQHCSYQLWRPNICSTEVVFRTTEANWSSFQDITVARHNFTSSWYSEQLLVVSLGWFQIFASKLFVSPFPSIWPNYNISPGFPWNFRRFPETLVTF